ncbi:hypothetical protein N2152v2_003928 [Parachlorella kessleri]
MSAQDAICGQFQAAGDGDVLTATGETPLERELFDKFVLKKAGRRCPRTHKYTAIACPNMKAEGRCQLGDKCPFAHNDFEYWLHPERYHTCLCKKGEACNRKICFFAHKQSELRTPTQRPRVPPGSVSAAAMSLRQQAAAAGSAGNRGGLSPLASSQPEAGAGLGSLGSLRTSPRSSLESSMSYNSAEGADCSALSGVLGGSGSCMGFALDQLAGGGSGELAAPALHGPLEPPTPVILPATGGLLPAQGSGWAPPLAGALSGSGSGFLDFPMAAHPSTTAAAALPAPLMPAAPAAAPATATSTQALIQAVSAKLREGSMNAATATTILGSLLPPEALLKLTAILEMQSGSSQVAAAPGQATGQPLGWPAGSGGGSGCW